MRKHFIGLLAIALLISCKNGAGDQTEKINSVFTVSIPAQELIGSFVGMFGDNKITLLITKVTPDSVLGRSIVAGNDRPFKGYFQQAEHAWKFSVKEPGNHKDDGKFDFTIYAFNIDSITGTWQAYDSERPEKKYELTRRKFEYHPEYGLYPEASIRLLREEDVENMTKEGLEIMRNEIFARHGYSFSKKHLREQFEMNDWYVPNTNSVQENLSSIEKRNISLIKRYEAYAEEYGDEFGR
ncbi:MAG: YARHG domain-containing protein [Bacteroidota bacterium]